MATLSSPTLGKLISNVRNFLNQPTAANSTWSDEEITDYLNKAIQRYFGELTLNCEGQFTTQTDLNIVADTETVALPTDFFEIKALYKKVNDGYEILPYQNNLTYSYTTQGGTGESLYRPSYYFRDNNLVLRPVPNFSETAGLRLEYVRFPETLINGGDTMSTSVSPVFQELIEMYAVYKAKLKESLVNGVEMHRVAAENLNQIYKQFTDVIANRSNYPQYTAPYLPESEN